MHFNQHIFEARIFFLKHQYVEKSTSPFLFIPFCNQLISFTELQVEMLIF